MEKHFPQNPFERYADDCIVHCQSEAEAQKLKQAIAKRLLECGLELHPVKTKTQDSLRTVQIIPHARRNPCISSCTLWSYITQHGIVDLCA